MTIGVYAGNGDIPRLCLALLGDTPRLSLELAVEGLAMSCPVGPDPCPDGSCSGLRPLSCCLTLGPSLDDTFWRKSGGLASYRKCGLEEEGEVQEKKPGRRSEGDGLELEGGGRGSVLQTWVGAPAWEPLSSPHVLSRTVMVGAGVVGSLLIILLFERTSCQVPHLSERSTLTCCTRVSLSPLRSLLSVPGLLL